MTRIAVLLALALLALVAAPAGAQEAERTPDGVQVVGEAGAFADNDTATFGFGVTVRRRTASAALRSAAAATQRIVGALRVRGVTGDDVQTAGVSLQRSSRRGRRTTFVARNSVTAAIRPASRAGAVIDAAVGAGATSVDGPEFSASGAAEAYRRALVLAYAEARAKAERLAQQGGFALGRPIRVVEGGDPESVDEEQAASGGGGTTESAQFAPVRPGRTRIEATVLVVFAIA